MTLIDYFNKFQEVSNAKHFSANARSLYFAILSEFNRLRYPNELKLRNTYLQDMSGITSTASFDSARNALLNAKLITHKKQVYTLETSEKTLRKSFEKVLKESQGLLTNPGLPLKTEKEGDLRETAAPSTTETSGQLNLAECSAAVRQIWEAYTGRPLTSGLNADLAKFEGEIGTQQLITEIQRAARSNKRESIDLNYLEAFVHPRKKPQAVKKPLESRLANDAAQFFEGM